MADMLPALRDMDSMRSAAVGVPVLSQELGTTMTRDTTHQLTVGIVVLLAALFGVLSCSLLSAAQWPRTLVRWPTTIKSPAHQAGPAPVVPAGTSSDTSEVRGPLTRSSGEAPKSPSASRSTGVPPSVPAGSVTGPPAASGGCVGGNCSRTKQPVRFFNLWRK